VRDKEIKIATHTESLSHTQVPKVALPKYKAWGDQLRWICKKMFRANFHYTAGLFHLNAKAKIQRVCLRVKVDLNVPTNVFIMSP
jgi:hypothetical protein